MADELTPAQQEVTSQEGALVGDENQPEAREVEVTQNTEAVPAQVSPPRGPEAETVPVFEVAVALDEPVLDPSSPEAVQIPDAGRGDLTLPIHGLSAPSPEEALAGGSAPEAEPTPDPEPQAPATPPEQLPPQNDQPAQGDAAQPAPTTPSE